MKYLVFAGDNYYPSGGWDDYVDSTTSIEDALVLLLKVDRDWWHIVDKDSFKIVRSGR